MRQRAADRIKHLFDRLVARPQLLPERFQNRVNRLGAERGAGEFLAGLTDKACDALYTELVELAAIKSWVGNLWSAKAQLSLWGRRLI